MDSNQRLDAIMQLAKQHDYDAEHAHQVECLAGTLFIELADLHGLDRGDRKLLEYAAILHDIGYSRGSKGHHRTALALIVSEPFTEFSVDEKLMIANIARYHRKAVPAQEHTFFGALSEKDRERVTYLAAILRVADALDRSHKHLVTELTCSVQDDVVILNIICGDDLSTEQDAVSRRSDLFRQVFRKTPRIEAQVPRLASSQDVYAHA
jgi:exopolyphosphatase/guanosine-5'-triphosphate,3'-diphosphate pyrophosphatase